MSDASPEHGPSEPSPQQVTQLLSALGAGDQHAAEELLPLIYDELRKLARARMAGERANHTLDPTALVHEAYMRLVDQTVVQKWDGRGHFFGAAAQAMRRILVERARHRGRLKRGGDQKRVGLEADAVVSEDDPTNLLALDEALERLEAFDRRKAQVVMLRYFAGLSIEETAAAMDLSPATVKNEWSFARAWLRGEMMKDAAV
jgi:RNA polymerase sigma factor (TIGR02999 family)